MHERNAPTKTIMIDSDEDLEVLDIDEDPPANKILIEEIED